MPDPTQAALQAIIDYCTRRWTEADDEPVIASGTEGSVARAEITGLKIACNDVLQHARQMLAAQEPPASAS